MGDDDHDGRAEDKDLRYIIGDRIHRTSNKLGEKGWWSESGTRNWVNGGVISWAAITGVAINPEGNIQHYSWEIWDAIWYSSEDEYQVKDGLCHTSHKIHRSERKRLWNEEINLSVVSYQH